MKDTVGMNMNKIVQFLAKPTEEFTKPGLIEFTEENKIEMVNFRYVGEVCGRRPVN